eukprot:270600_1
MSYKIGTAVALKNNLHGTIKYIGKMRGRKGIWYGIKLTSPNGNNDGMHSCRYYFLCKQNYGIFVKKKQIKCIISDTKAAFQYQKMAKLREKNITLFDVTCLIDNNEDINDHKDDEKYIDYESSILHQFLRFSLSTLINYLDNNTLYNLFDIEYFTSFYDISSFWNVNMLIDRLINTNNNVIYRQLQLNGIYINIWNVDGALNSLKCNEYIIKQEWKIRKYRFLIFVAIQHIKSHIRMYDFSRVRYHGYNQINYKTIIKANCNQLNEQYIKVYGDLGVISNDLISVNYGQYDSLSGCVKKYKNFKDIFDGNANRKIALFRKRNSVKSIVKKIEKLLIIPISDLLVKHWILFNTQRHTLICGWITSNCIIVVLGGCRPTHGWR